MQREAESSGEDEEEEAFLQDYISNLTMNAAADAADDEEDQADKVQVKHDAACVAGWCPYVSGHAKLVSSYMHTCDMPHTPGLGLLTGCTGSFHEECADGG